MSDQDGCNELPSCNELPIRRCPHGRRSVRREVVKMGWSAATATDWDGQWFRDTCPQECLALGLHRWSSTSYRAWKAD